MKIINVVIVKGRNIREVDKGLLKGSACKNTASKFSDIDLIIKGMDKDTAEQLK